MRTLEEIKNHLSKVEYDDYAKFAIHGFLVGRGDIQPYESLEWADDHRKVFDDFMKWFKEECREDLTFGDAIVLDGVVYRFSDKNKTKYNKLKELIDDLDKLNDAIYEGERVDKSGNPYGNLIIESMLNCSYKLREDLKKKIDEEMGK